MTAVVVCTAMISLEIDVNARQLAVQVAGCSNDERSAQKEFCEVAELHSRNMIRVCGRVEGRRGTVNSVCREGRPCSSFGEPESGLRRSAVKLQISPPQGKEHQIQFLQAK
jgi:hypothetical protein